MKYIIISGIDGSGKTTIINNLQKYLSDEGYETSYIWLRFNHYFTKLLNATARVLKLSVKTHNEMGTVWQHQFYKSSLFCWIYINGTYIDTWISRLKLWKKSNNRIDFLICDRWINDILIDLGTKTHNKDFLSTKWYSRFKKIIPENSIQFVIYRDIHSVMDCRLENRIDPDFPLRMALYEKLKSEYNIHIINNNQSIEESIHQIIKVLNNEQK